VLNDVLDVTAKIYSNGSTLYSGQIYHKLKNRSFLKRTYTVW